MGVVEWVCLLTLWGDMRESPTSPINFLLTSMIFLKFSISFIVSFTWDATDAIISYASTMGNRLAKQDWQTWNNVMWIIIGIPFTNFRCLLYHQNQLASSLCNLHTVAIATIKINSLIFNPFDTCKLLIINPYLLVVVYISVFFVQSLVDRQQLWGCCISVPAQIPSSPEQTVSSSCFVLQAFWGLYRSCLYKENITGGRKGGREGGREGEWNSFSRLFSVYFEKRCSPQEHVSQSGIGFPAINNHN